MSLSRAGFMLPELAMAMAMAMEQQPGQFRAAHTHLFLGNLSRRIIISNILGQLHYGVPPASATVPAPHPTLLPLLALHSATQRNKRILKWSFDMNYARCCNYSYRTRSPLPVSHPNPFPLAHHPTRPFPPTLANAARLMPLSVSDAVV